MSDKRILIVGAGIAGLVMVHALRQQGLDAEIIEREPDWSAAGSGIGLPANTVDGLVKLGFEEQLLASAHRISQIEYALANGQTLALASLSEPPLNKQPFLALLRKDLIDILRQGIDGVRFNTTIQSMTQNDAGIDVVFSSGETTSYDLVIAADGIRSSTRAMVFPQATLKSFGLTNWRFMIQRETTGMHPVYYLGKDDVFMLYPVSENQVYCYAHLYDKSLKQAGRDPLHVFKERFSHYPDSVTSAIESIENPDDVIVGRIESVEVDTPISGRVVLIGDALHGCSPSLQQGAGQAVADALVLSEQLSKLPVDVALQEFQTRRWKEIQWVVRESNKIMKQGLVGRFWLGRFLRNIKIRLQGPVNVIGWKKLMQKSYG